MKRVVLYTLGLIACLAVLLTAMLAYARRSGTDQLANGSFALCEGYPCYDGIVPGLTTWAQAKMILRENAQESTTSSFSMLSLDENGAPISFYSHGAMMGFIGANYWKAKTPITVGQLTAIFGVPCAVRMVVDDQGKPTFIQALHYPTTTIFVGYIARLTPQAAVTLINVYKPSLGSQCYAGADSQTGIALWEGFAAASHYTTLPTTNMMPSQLN